MTGSVTLNGINDAELALAIKFKADHEGVFGFNPSQMQNAQLPGNPSRPGYNNMVFTWTNVQGLKKVIELLQKLEHHKSAPAA